MSASPAEIPGADGATSPSQLFVINLCASTSPMALAQPNVPALKRYTFFVSRQRDDGRDRFRLHMGYFASQQEAEQLLDAVRDIYPAAWTGPAPANGAPRRNRVAVATVAPVVSVATPVPAPAPVKPVAEAAPAMVEMPPRAVVAQPESQPLADVMDAMSSMRNVLAELDSMPSARMQSEQDNDKTPLKEDDVLRVLEASEKSVAESGKYLTQPRANVRLVTEQDTQAPLDAQSDADENAPPCFAVQLVWSVSPIDVARLPHLAIFDAYTLYNVEGNRDGRKWYGVRLGFFSDPTAANQVANYVRSDYRAVAIVPVAVKEREGAGGGAAARPAVKPAATKKVPVAKPVAPAQQDGAPLEGFQLLADDRPAPLKLDLDDKPAAKVPAKVPVAKPVAESAAKTAAKAAAPRVPGKATGKPVGKRVVARKRTPPRPGAPNPLESTLEILGASTLTLDEGRTIIDDSAVRKPVDRKPGGRFSKLLSRLSGNQG